MREFRRIVRQRRRTECLCHRGIKLALHRLHIGQDTRLRQRHADAVSLKQLTHIRGQRIQRITHPAGTFRRTVTKPDHPFTGMPNVIGQFLDSLLRMRGKLLIGRTGHFLPERMHESGKKELPQNGVGKITIRLFDHQDMAKGGAIAQKRIIILGFTATFDFCRIAITHARRSQQIKRHVRQCQIFFQHRCVPAPFAQSVAKDQMIITKANQQRQQIILLCLAPWPGGWLGGWLGHVLTGRRYSPVCYVTGGCHYICPTSSGMS